MNANVDELRETLARARQEVAKIIIGQNEVVDKALITIFTGHHALIEGVPGVAKTLLVRTLAHVLGCGFARIQFTPDLMPADITGTSIFNMQRNEFTLIPGPVFTSFLLAEELTLAKRTIGVESPEATLAGGAVQPVVTAEALAAMRGHLNNIVVRDELVAYLVDIVRATRKNESVLVGAGPRATQALLLASRAFAAVSSRDFVTPDDIKAMAVPVLEHRLILRPEFEIEGVTVTEVVQKILEQVAVPR